MKRIVDLSEFNSVTDWEKLKASCDGVILRVGFRGYGSGNIVFDEKFKKSFEAVKNYKIPFSIYFTTQAINEVEAKEEAGFCIRALNGTKTDFPVFIDSEDSGGGLGRADGWKLNKEQRTNVLKAFCKEIEANGYKAGVYASCSWLQDRADYTKLTNYFLWVAQYSSSEPSIPWDAWQYTSSELVNGIFAGCDVSKWTDNETEEKPKEEKKEEPKGNTYTVKAGDTLGEIAQKYNTTVSELARINGISNPNLIYAGQVLKLDGAKVEEPKKEPKKEAKKTYTVKAGDTLSEIAQKFNTTISRLVELNGINNPNLIQTGQVLKLDDNAKEKTYTVKAGDTLGEIAEKFGASVYEIAEKNNIKDINIIYVGQVLKI
jgi:LysM repeat protein